MVEYKGQIESGVAVPSAFGIQKHRTVWADQDVFRADIAMHQDMFVCQGLLHQTVQSVGAIGVTQGSGIEIRIKANGDEICVVVKSLCQHSIVGAGPMPGR